MKYFFCMLLGAFLGGGLIVCMMRKQMEDYQTAYDDRLEEIITQEARVNDYKRKLEICYFTKEYPKLDMDTP